MLDLFIGIINYRVQKISHSNSLIYTLNIKFFNFENKTHRKIKPIGNSLVVDAKLVREKISKFNILIILRISSTDNDKCSYS